MPNSRSPLKSPDFRELFLAFPEPLLVLLPDFTIVAASDACLQFLVTKREAILGRNLFDVLPGYLEPGAEGRLRASLLRVLKERLPDAVTVRRRVPGHAEGANPRHAERIWRFASSAVPAASGEVAYIIHRLDEIPLAGHVEQGPTGELSDVGHDTFQQLLKSRKNFEALGKEYENFAHSVSHDLRAPLRGIDMYAGVVSEDYYDLLDDEGRRLLDLIRNLARKMNGLIDDLLKFSRLGRHRMLAGALDMTGIAQSVFVDLQAKTPGRNVRFELRDLPPAFGDASLIKQAFAHLLSNALKFTGPREHAFIEVTGTNDAVQNTYCVRDNGVGFDPQFAGKLFGIFQRMHPQEEFEGAGAGLALTQRIIQRHGGRIWAQAKEGEGATFFFTLPRLTPANETES